MKSRYLSILLIHSLLLLLTPIFSVYSQSKRLQFTHLTTDDGLSSSIATSILQDHKGFIWIGTPNGLNRYDGFNFVVYKKKSTDSTSLYDNVVNTMFEDQNMNLFIGTEKGLCVYDREKDRFLNYILDKPSPLRGIECSVNEMDEDSLGNLWLATSVGLIYFDRIINQIIQFTHDPNDPESLSNDNVEDVLIDRNNRLWVATRKGLNQFLPETGTFKHISRAESDADDLLNTVFMNMIEDREGNLWFGSTEGLYCLKYNTKAITENLIHYQHDVQDNSSLSINLVTSLYVDNIGNLWIGTDNGGINLFDREKQSFRQYRKDEYDPQSLNNETIRAICQDRTGNLWFGTYTGGLNVAIKNRDAIIKYQNVPGAPFSLSHNTVTCFSEDHLCQTWVGTDGGGLNLFDKDINHFLHFNMKNSSLSSDAILCMLEDSKNQIWLGTWTGGLVLFDEKTKSFTSFTTVNSGIQDDNIFTVAEGDNDDLWLGSYEHGLIHYQIKAKKFTEYTPDNSGLVNEMVIKIAKLSKGHLLIGTVNGFQLFYPGSDHFITYASDQDNANSLSYPRITDILVENDSCVWIGTSDGLNLFNPDAGSFIRYYEKDGLPDNSIKGLVLDTSGVIWVTTSKGVCRFDYVQGKYRIFTIADGLQSNEFSERSILKTKSGALLMGGTKGFNIVYPEKIAENKSIPDVLITDLKIFNKSIEPGVENSPLIQNITETKTLNLSHKQSVLTFYFAVMDFTAPGKNQYAYKMEGFDKDWIYSGNKREATYTNLNSGEYVFRAKGSNNDGIWNETGTSIRITILPPWWNTWWFKLIIIFTIFFILASIYLSRVRRLNNQKIMLEKLVAIKTTELSELNASKDKFFSILAHDLRSPLSSFVGATQVLTEDIQTMGKEEIMDITVSMKTSASNIYNLLENLLEWSRLMQGQMEFVPVKFNLKERIEACTGILSEYAGEKRIEIAIVIPDELEVLADDHMFDSVIRNLVSNAIKFTPAGGKVSVTADCKNDHSIEVEISDSGIGMTPELKSKLFLLTEKTSRKGTEGESSTGLGLLLCKEFIEKHGGKIWVESEPGKGSIFKFSLPSDINPSV